MEHSNNIAKVAESTAVYSENMTQQGEIALNEKVDCSHRVIEKRRRDRINNSLLQLSKLVPMEKGYKKNSGKLEKAEILEVTVRYVAQQQFEKENAKLLTTCEISKGKQTRDNVDEQGVFLRGFKQCVKDATKFFEDVEELVVSEGRCFRLLEHLKKQISQYENDEGDHHKAAIKDCRAVWDTASETSDVSSCITSSDSVRSKRKNEGVDNSGGRAAHCKKRKPPPSPPIDQEQDRSSSGVSSPSNSDSSSNMNSDSSSMRNSDSSSQSISDSLSHGNSSSLSRGYMPMAFPNMPMFTQFPFAGPKGMPHFQSPQGQLQSLQGQFQSPQGQLQSPQGQFQSPQGQFQSPQGQFQFPQGQFSGFQPTPQYIPVAMPQFPMMGMNFMPGFGMMNCDQSQNGGSMASSIPMSSGGPTNAPFVPSAVPGGFLSSMYTNGIHANIMAMRPRDSGYESSSKSSSSKASELSENCHQSFSD